MFCFYFILLLQAFHVYFVFMLSIVLSQVTVICSIWSKTFVISFFFFRNEIDPDNPSHSQYAQSLVSQLIQEIENKALSYANNEDLFLVRMRLDEAATSFKVML